MRLLDQLRAMRRHGIRRHTANTDGPDEALSVDQQTGEILDAGPPHNTPPAEPDGHGEAIPGDRALPSVNRERSVRALVGNTLAIGTLAVLTLGVLAWYYSAQWARAHDAQTAATKDAEARTAGELKLPPLGRVDPPQPVKMAAAASAPFDILSPPPPPPAAGFTPTAAQGPAAKTPQQLEAERKLGIPVLLQPRPVQPAPLPREVADSRVSQLQGTQFGAPATPLSSLLRPTATPAVAAQTLPTRRFLLPKGAFVDCTLETAIDSTFDGMVTCIGASDVYGADGKVVLLERGTKYVGEKRGELKQGQGRVFVLWSEARTPTGVVVQLASPGTDELGRSGLPGAIDTHFWDRFGAAILISVIDGTIQALAASQQHGTSGPAVIFNPQTSRDVMTEVLKGTIAIPPTVVKNQGERIQVLVARDVDFRSVYGLRSDDEGR
jgi:type IV secretion system protein VirB10